MIGTIRKATQFIVLGATVLLIGWDIYAYFSADNSTISVVITDWSRVYPSIALIAGILIGHWFFPAKGSLDK